MAYRPVVEKTLGLGSGNGPRQYVLPDRPIDEVLQGCGPYQEAWPVCEQCRKRGVNGRPAGWLMVITTTHLHWLCSWGCLRDYCNATVIEP